MLSYRAGIVSDWLSLLLQIFLFSFVGRMVDVSALPSYGGQATTYLEFVTIGVAIGTFLPIGLGKVVGVVRNEQLMGTLESVLVTPTRTSTLLLGSVLYDLAYVPLRTLAFLWIAAAAFDVRIAFEQLLPAVAVLAAFVPVVWGLGVTSAATVLTFRRGSGLVGFGAGVLMLGSGAYFPIELLPEWTHAVLAYNPLTIALEAAREALLGGAGWAQTLPDVLLLLPMAAASLTVGSLAFRWALRRELRRGTVNLY